MVKVLRGHRDRSSLRCSQHFSARQYVELPGRARRAVLHQIAVLVAWIGRQPTAQRAQLRNIALLGISELMN